MQLARHFRSRTLVFLHDLTMVCLAWLGAFWLRFNMVTIPEQYWQAAIDGLPFILIVQGIVLRIVGLYRGVWRFASIPDLLRIGQAVLIGTAISAIALFLHDRLTAVPRSALPLYALLLGLLLCTPRLLYRIWKDGLIINGTGQRALIVGAGIAGEMLARDLLRRRDSEFLPVAFVDDDPKKRGWEIHGVRVRGQCNMIPQLIEQFGIEILLIAVPSATDQQMRHVVEICEATGLPFLTLPSVQELMSGPVSRQILRDVAIEDLLGRAPIRLDNTAIRSAMEGKTILVTGGGGSIGSELCRQIARYPIDKLIIFEKTEFNLYRVEQLLQRQYPHLKLHALLGDITDVLAIERAVSLYKTDMIFHAAAYKHVPLLQQQIRAAVYNNILGTWRVAQAALKYQVPTFVLISTDKAVNPTNIMGATKRAAELLLQKLDQEHHHSTHFITVRFGNVLDSAGSVVPLFKEQIKAGGPVTVTHPDITRYFMTIPEASQLIMQAACMGKGQEIFVLDMGEPIKITYLAEQMIRLSGKRPNLDIKIDYIGLRPGEKLYEELFYSQEQLMPTSHKKILLTQGRPLLSMDSEALLQEMTQACEDFDEVRLHQLLHQLVPEYREKSC